MQKQIKNRIIKNGFVNWKECKWLQPDNLKKYSEVQMQKLKTSLLNNGFASPFILWKDVKDQDYILDAHHRQKAFIELEEIDNVNIPKKLPAIWIDCKNKKEVKKLILVYNSHYADIEQDIFTDWIKDLKIDELESEIDIKGIDLKLYDFEENIKEKEIDENLETDFECPKCGYKWS